MSQNDLVIANQSFPSFRTDLNSALQAINTSQSGTSRPSGAVAGTIWLDTTSATSPTLKYYDGADDISLATLDHVGNAVNWLDSTVSVTGITTTATGTVLTLSDTSQTSSVNLILQNQKEIRFSETTANGVNYVGFKAPASLTADKIWILPSADGSAGQFLKTDGAGNLSFSSDLPTTSFTGATVETSIADSDLVLIYDDSATAVRKMTKANLVAGIGATAGQVIQVVSATDSTERSTTSSSFVTGSNTLSVSITPSSASNKIFIISTFQGRVTGGTPAGYTIYRNSTNLGNSSGMIITPSNDPFRINTAISYYDSPATTSATTYQVYMKVLGSGTIYIGGSSEYSGTTSSLTAFEVKG